MRHKYLLSLGLLFVLMENIMVESCDKGYKKVKGKCEDEDECEPKPNICGKNATCSNTVGSYYCHCHRGFTPAGNFTQTIATECTDVNECGEERGVCGPNAECTNTEGGYNCTCENGYISSSGSKTFQAELGVECNDRNECEDLSVCGENAACHNTPGHFYCTCAPGFTLTSGETIFNETDKTCEKLNFDIFTRDIKGSQSNPDLAKLVSLMNNSCLEASEHAKQVDGKRLLQRFLDILDGLLQHDFHDDNKIISAMFDIVERMLKITGLLLPEGQTKTTANETEVELLVKKGKSPSQGELIMSTSNITFTTDWDTATGKPYFGFTTAALLGYKNLEKSLNGHFNHLEKKKKQSFKINSKVVTITVSNTETHSLEKPVTLKFSHLENSNADHICVFWDHKLEGGAWSTRNCTKEKSSESETVCSCSHLSSFAVLMALYDIGDVYELQLITWVGLSLSLVCLFICIITFRWVRSIQSTRNTIHLHLCISLFIGYFVFLVGIARTENKVGCSVVAGVLHYFFLASFCWMCLEGVQLFRMVVLVFNTTLRRSYMMAVGYGLPAVIVAVSASVNASGYGTKRYCWLNFEDGFIWSFYGPVCVIIIVNVFFFLITIWKLAEKFSSLNPDLDNLRRIKAFTVTAIAQLCVLGIMWVFGCFQFNENTLAMSYIFTILSSLQGVLMFVMHCWLSKQVREEYVKFLSCVCTPQKRKYSEFSSNQTSKSQTSKSVQHTGQSHI